MHISISVYIKLYFSTRLLISVVVNKKNVENVLHMYGYTLFEKHLNMSHMFHSAIYRWECFWLLSRYRIYHTYNCSAKQTELSSSIGTMLNEWFMMSMLFRYGTEEFFPWRSIFINAWVILFNFRRWGGLGVGVGLIRHSPPSRYFQNISELSKVFFIFDRDRCGLAVVTPVRYEGSSRNLTGSKPHTRYFTVWTRFRC